MDIIWYSKSILDFRIFFPSSIFNWSITKLCKKTCFSNW